ncbi:hypothetical protein J6590_010787 [Homalodisca vitripennis]|nr:hypothetical protein J6590_010787 [Homalodisca vitripennis]
MYVADTVQEMSFQHVLVVTSGLLTGRGAALRVQTKRGCQGLGAGAYSPGGLKGSPFPRSCILPYEIFHNSVIYSLLLQTMCNEFPALKVDNYKGGPGIDKEMNLSHGVRREGGCLPSKYRVIILPTVQLRWNSTTLQVTSMRRTVQLACWRQSA